MTVQNGKKERYTSGGGYYEKYVYDVIVKTEGNYVETLINQELYESGMIVDDVENPSTIVNNSIEYKMYPNMTVDAALSAHGIAGYSWSAPLATV